MGSIMNDIVEIRVFYWLHEAEMARMHLESCGISSEIFNAGITAINPLLGGAVGGVKLMVRKEDYEESQKILDQYDREQNR
ncbi:MAG: hypothetical protein GF344_14025 [Chitinivibrionales bacterium]|nr:hypothetical protein [Chitinivibrionales bacterium]MBD3357843.1 hypothetical protein [Chitinivibrionales bacterium]